MVSPPRGVLHQSFLPDSTRAFVWKYSPVNGGRRPRHFHIEPELNLVVSGSALFGVGRTLVKVSPGELIGFPAGQDHVLLEGTEDLYLYAVGVEPRLSAEVLRGTLDGARLPLHVRLPSQELRTLTRRASDIVDKAGTEQLCAELWEQAHWVGRRSTTGQTAALHVLTRRTLTALAENPELGLEALSKRLRANASEVSRYFHRDLGMTFVRYRTRLRLLRFIQLVDQGKGSWMTCASTAGFGSYSQCHRTFQSELGCAPRAFFLSGLRQEMQQVYDG